MSAWSPTVRRTRTGKLLASSLLVTALAMSPAVADTFDTTFTALLNGAQETPPVASPSTGVAFLTFNKDNSNLCWAISYTPLAGTEFVAHFHGPANKGDVAGPGVSSPVTHEISPSPSPLGSPKQGCVVLTSKQQIKDLKSGLWYINIHTMGPPPASTAGEIRGQVLPVKGVKYKKVPPIATTTTTTTSTTTTTMASPSGAFLD